jgi:hypothetical protein
MTMVMMQLLLVMILNMVTAVITQTCGTSLKRIMTGLISIHCDVHGAVEAVEAAGRRDHYLLRHAAVSH